VLRSFKDLQKVVVELKGWGGADKAKEVIEKSREE
jgi:inorganic pyrophosphatase